MRILIAEDDPVSRRLLQGLLAKWGYDVIVSSNGEEAWNLLQNENPPRLAILDWMMPGLDGLQVCRNVRKRRDDVYTYLLLLTAKSQKQDLLEGLDAGADDYVTKPFDANELKARLRAGRRILDLQAELLSMREALREQATHDPLTGLPNRLLFSDRLTQKLVQSRRKGTLLAVMFFDLDRFKLINDTLGHNVGDHLLKEIAKRLTATLREMDTIARMGGDEFIVITSEIIVPEDAAAVARKILKSLSEPFILDSQELFITASIGISMYPADGVDVETLVKNADSAMYRAKEQGRNNYQLYTEVMTNADLERVSLENGLRKALERDEFLIHYQPRVDIATGKTVGAEALVRWQHKELGLVPPNQFIPLAEETGLIVPISEWVLNTACAQNKAWQDAGLPPVDITVNVSARVFQQDQLQNMVTRALHETKLDAQYLGLEVTENTLSSNSELTTRVLRTLKDMGVRVSIDDFGVGHSSLNYLKNFPIDAVKIDQSFIKELNTNPNVAATAGAIIAMAHSLKLQVIAEGVETLEQLDFLRSLDCDEMQGYFISPPLSSDKFTDILKEANKDRFDSAA